MRRSTAMLVVVVFASAIATMLWSPTDRAAAQWSSDRLSEVIVVPGSSLTPFLGASANHLWVWSWQDRWVLEPSQMDERDAAGGYVTTEDGVFDANDEVVFALNVGGLQAPEGEWPPGIERTYSWAQVAVSDPLHDNETAYVYVFRSWGGPEIAVEPLVRFDAGTKEITTNQYVLGMANPVTDGYVGMKRLSLFGATTDLLDRMKIRATVVIFGSEQEVTEESLALLGELGIEIGGLTPDPIIVGPVRAVYDAAGAMIVDPWTIQVALDGLGDVGGFVEMGAIRVSLDFSAEALPATYTDANSSEAVPVDGSPDEVPGAPLPRWREMSFGDGRITVVTSPQEGAEASVYYKDDEAVDANDTGDGASFGDNGVMSDSAQGFVDSGYPGTMIVLPPDSPLTPLQLVAGIDNPLGVNVTMGAVPPTPTAGGPTYTPYPTPTAPPTATQPLPTPTFPGGFPTRVPPTATSGPPPGGSTPIYLPMVVPGR